MNPEILHTVIMVAVIGISFLFPQTVFAAYDMQISAALFIVFFLARRYFGDRLRSRLLESVVFTFVVMMTINSTGGIASPFFFLLYFLLFSLSLLLEPVISITSTLALIAFFILNMAPNQPWKALLPVFSLAFLTPFALFMGQEFVEAQREKTRAKRLQEAMSNAKENTFLFLSLMIKNQLKSMKHTLENYMGDHDLHNLKKHVRTMEHLIEKFETEQDQKV